MVDLGVAAPFDGESLLRFLAARAIPRVERVDGDMYLRTLPDGSVLALRLGRDRAAAGALRGDEGTALAAARRLLGTGGGDADAALSADPALRPAVAARPGLRAPGAVDAFEAAVRAILGQQISVAAARTQAARLAAAHGAPLEPPLPELDRLFPTPDALAQARLPGPRSRAGALHALAAAPEAATDPAELQALPGVGPWTAAYVALRSGDPDAFLPTDLVVRRGAQTLGLDPQPVALTARAERWRPHRSVAVMHLWAAG